MYFHDNSNTDIHWYICLFPASAATCQTEKLTEPTTRATHLCGHSPVLRQEEIPQEVAWPVPAHTPSDAWAETDHTLSFANEEVRFVELFKMITYTKNILKFILENAYQICIILFKVFRENDFQTIFRHAVKEKLRQWCQDPGRSSHKQQ